MDTDNIILVPPATVLTCADHDPGEEWPNFVREERIAARAHERHESRIRAAEYAIARYYFRDGQEDGEAIPMTPAEVRRAATLAAMEAHGIGGPRGYRGGATVRMPWARSLGKGRHNASDGDAWDAAIRSAFGGLTPTPGDVAEVVDCSMSSADIEWAVAYASDMAVCASTPEEAHAWAAAREVAMIWRRWLTTADHDAPGGSSDGIERVEEETAPHLVAAKAWPSARPQESDKS